MKRAYQRDSNFPIVSITQFTAAMIWNQPSCPWIKKCTRDHYLDTKKNKYCYINWNKPETETQMSHVPYHIWKWKKINASKQRIVLVREG